MSPKVGESSWQPFFPQFPYLRSILRMPSSVFSADQGFSTHCEGLWSWRGWWLVCANVLQRPIICFMVVSNDTLLFWTTTSSTILALVSPGQEVRGDLSNGVTDRNKSGKKSFTLFPRVSKQSKINQTQENLCFWVDLWLSHSSIAKGESLHIVGYDKEGRCHVISPIRKLYASFTTQIM